MPLRLVLLKVGTAADLDHCACWYERYLDLMRFDARAGEYVILAEGDDHPHLALHVGEPTGHPERISIYFEVEDVERVISDLVAADWPVITFPVDKSWGGRVAAFTDPVGHIVKPYHVIERLAPPTSALAGDA